MKVRAELKACAWCLVFVVIEVSLYISYQAHEARFHWFTHFFVGSSVALMAMSAFVMVTRRPARVPLIWPVAAHVFAIIPDFLFTAGVAHQRWMNVFLGHLAGHFVPGRNWTWYAVFLVSLGIYLALIGLIASSSGAGGTPVVAPPAGVAPRRPQPAAGRVCCVHRPEEAAP